MSQLFAPGRPLVARSRPRRAVARSRPARVLPPPAVSSIAVSIGVTGYYRVADPGIEGYELHHGVDAPPDLDAAPDYTFAALPFETPPLATDADHQFVLRYRNRWNLITDVREPTHVRLDGEGAQTDAPPRSPYDLTASATVGGTVTITARYDALSDGDNAADEWLLWLTTSGVDPDPDSGMAIVTPIYDADGVARFEHVTDALAEGTPVKALVRVRQAGSIDPPRPDLDSVNTEIVSATATLIGPAAVAPADAYLGEAARQNQ